MKVETHNHPTAIAPDPGAATGSGGEIRDEGATGRGSKPKTGLCGFSVSNLKLPNSIQPWEIDYGKPSQIASALEIMIDGPIGAASFNNEFGRPNTCGYFRTYEQETKNGDVRGYHKPIMLAGGIGNIKKNHVEKGLISDGDKIIVLGGPAMLIGLDIFETFESAEASKWASIFGTQNSGATTPTGSSVNTSEDPDSDGSFTETVGAEEFLNEFGGNPIKSPFQDGHYIYTVIAGTGSGSQSVAPIIFIADLESPSSFWKKLQP